jgi:DNA-binding CsgD family transcriptional regulator
MDAFVGRVQELERIESMFAGDGPAAAVVVGDPGIGKSSLLSAVVGEADRVLRVAGFESAQLVPLASAADLLRTLVAVPEHGALLDEVTFRAPATTDKVRVFEAAYRALAAGSVEPLLVVDDLQWVDDLSLALVHYLVRAAAATGPPIRVLAAGRRVARTVAFADEVGRALGPSAETIELAPFEEEESLRLVLYLDPAVDRERAMEICARSGGVPFWIEVLARARGLAVDAGGLLTGRLRDAGADAGILLGLLAVAARPLGADDAAELVVWPRERLDAVVDELVTRGVAVGSGDSIAVAHDLLREAAYDVLPVRRRRELHNRLAAWLEATAGDDVSPLREALAHRRAAGEQPLELALRLARTRRRALLGADGLSRLTAIADGADRGPEELALRVEIAELAAELGDASASECWAVLAERLEAPAERARAFLRAARLARGRGDKARELLVRARTFAPADIALTLRLDTFEAGLLLAGRTDDPRGRELAADVARRRRELDADEREALFEALRLEYQISLYDADGDRARDLAEELAEAARAIDENTRLRSLIDSGAAARLFGAFGAAEARLRPAWNDVRALVLPTQVVHCGYELASCLFRLGRLDEAEAVVAEAEDIARRLGNPGQSRFDTGRVAALISLERGDWQAGLVDVEKALAAQPDPHLRIDLRQAAALILARVVGPREDGRVLAYLETARAEADMVGCRRCSAELLLASGEALARLGRLDQARAATAAWDAGARADSGQTERFWRARTEAVMQIQSGHPAEAALQLERLLDEAVRLERHLDALWGRLDLAQAYSVTDRAAATECLERIALAARACGALTVAWVAEQRLRSLGVRTWRRGRTQTDGGLSKREREVAELVASGASNPEIAQALFLSRKTVEHHVSHILAKLGARNRAELATLLAHQSRAAHR